MKTPSPKLLNAARRGNAGAQYQLAANLAARNDDSKDILEAAQWYAKAAEQSHAEASYNLGLIHLRGELGRANKKQGLKLIEAASKLGSWDADWLLLQIYAQGLFGTAKNPRKAAIYLIRAMRIRYPQTAIVLAEFLQSKEGIDALIFAVQEVASGSKRMALEAAKPLTRCRSR